MKKFEIKNEKIRVILLTIGGILAGFVNGFLGTGGGILLVFALALTAKGESTPDSVRDRFATVIAVIIILSAVSVIFYGKTADMGAASPYIIPGMLGGAAGALLLDKINVKWLKRIFAIMVLWAGICFLR
ncbi:MAG: TSUP family transporter [Clostridiales bacterium]|nr:TSUP family transporter [Clostridiales bacterium]